jgi:hypothetical protein
VLFQQIKNQTDKTNNTESQKHDFESDYQHALTLLSAMKTIDFAKPALNKHFQFGFRFVFISINDISHNGFAFRCRNRSGRH